MRLGYLFAIAALSANVSQAQHHGNSLPSVGDQLPDVSAFDEDGREFSLSELRGDYSVLVFGCLT